MNKCLITGGVELNSQFMYFAILNGKNYSQTRPRMFKAGKKNYAVIL